MFRRAVSVAVLGSLLVLSAACSSDGHDDDDDGPTFSNQCSFLSTPSACVGCCNKETFEDGEIYEEGGCGCSGYSGTIAGDSASDTSNTDGTIGDGSATDTSDSDGDLRSGSTCRETSECLTMDGDTCQSCCDSYGCQHGAYLYPPGECNCS